MRLVFPLSIPFFLLVFLEILKVGLWAVNWASSTNLSLTILKVNPHKDAFSQSSPVSSFVFLLLTVCLIVKFGSYLCSCQTFVEDLVHLSALLWCEMVLPVSNLPFAGTQTSQSETAAFGFHLRIDKMLAKYRSMHFSFSRLLSGHLSWRRHSPYCRGSCWSFPSWLWRCSHLRSAAPEPLSGWSRRSWRPYGCSRSGPTGNRRIITAHYHKPLRCLTVLCQMQLYLFHLFICNDHDIGVVHLLLPT